MKTKVIVLLGIGAMLSGCWDDITHVYDCEIGEGADGSAADGDADGDSDGDADGDVGGDGQGKRPEGWEDFASPCVDHDECTGYPRARCVATSILGVIATPDGYCTACCDKAGDWCAEGVQCIGLDDVYLVCAATCDSDADCRPGGGWECRPIPPYLDTTAFPGDFCLPDDEHLAPDTDVPSDDIECDWTWSS